jgi:hypothetical protein
MKTLPKARQDGIIVRELDDEVLIYDRQRDQAHCLNRTAGFVWQHCDGRTRVATMARLLSGGTKTPVDESVVLLAVNQLAERHLLEEPFNPPAEVRVSRRNLVLKYAPAVLALPLVLSISAPTAAQAGTPTPTPTPDPCLVSPAPQGCPCSSDSDCDTSNCNGGVCGPQLRPKPE